MRNPTIGKIRRLRRYGFRLWAIAAEVKQPQQEVAWVLIRTGAAKLCEFELNRKLETRSEDAGLVEPT